ncbi:hypothetical protein SPF06_17500 [Sinomonas sp. JGH33]|uniref:Core-binding (CB) domain-containing protein n=1 Tax=Sinomonas terricola TaxID=3110330 RepID=A0ABU5TA11_9MICC|nr:hypothetical protein [Sinomonas sp. JGH33]MEA5456525.1 hypothetical protein [Sinomonas sp. JGH33]
MRASLPERPYARPDAVIDTGERLLVRFVPEAGGPGKDFEFRRLGLAPEIESAIVHGFARACGPAGSRRTLESVKTLYAGARVFARTLNELPSPPGSLNALAPSHIAPFRLRHTRYTNSLLQVFRVLFRPVEGLPTAFREALYAPHGPAAQSGTVSAYTDSEVRRIQRAARTEVRSALARIRKAEAELTEWETAGQGADPEAGRRGALLAQVARTGDVPRCRDGRINESKAHRGALDLLRSIFPSSSEVTALAVLLVCVSGHNLSTVCNMTASHLRVDDQLEEEPLVLTRASKPRRGRYGAEMDLALTQDGFPAGGPDDYASAAGVYRLAVELCARARAVAGTDALLVFHGTGPADRTPGGARIRPLPTHALEWWHGKTPDGGLLPRVDSRRLRLAFVQRHQRPVAHTAATLATEYLAKDAAALPEYQAIVGNVLDNEVERIRLGHRILTLTDTEVREAAIDPEPLAQRLGTTVERLKLLLEGRLDTVATACIDHTNSPHSPAGTACTASFLLCLGCPNARSEPRHIPIQTAMLESITRRRAEIPAVEWEERFSVAHEQLTDLLDRQHAGPRSADEGASDEDRALVELVLDRGLDLR